MVIEITKKFAKEARKLPPSVQLELQTIIRAIQNTDDLINIAGSKRLKSDKRDPGKYYRVRLGNYRIGIQLKEKTAKLVAIGDRKDIYRSFS